MSEEMNVTKEELTTEEKFNQAYDELNGEGASDREARDAEILCKVLIAAGGFMAGALLPHAVNGGKRIVKGLIKTVDDAKTKRAAKKQVKESKVPAEDADFREAKDDE